MELLIADQVHATGQFHGMPFQVRQSLAAAAETLFLALLLLWAGIYLTRRWLKSHPGQSR